MALFCTAIERDSASHLSFLFLVMSRFSCKQYHKFVAWNIHTVVFNYCFKIFVAFLFVLMLVLLLLTAVISLSLLFLMYSLRPFFLSINATSVLASSLLPFLDTYSLPISSFWWSSVFLSFGSFVWVPPLSLLRMVLNSSGKIESLRKKPIWIFTSARIYPPAVNSTF